MHADLAMYEAKEAGGGGWRVFGGTGTAGTGQASTEQAGPGRPHRTGRPGQAAVSAEAAGTRQH